MKTATRNRAGGYFQNSVPIESGNVAHAFVSHLQIDYKNVSEVTSEQPAELVSIAVRRMSQDEMERIQLGIATDRVVPPVAIDEPPVKQPTPPATKNSAWWMFWRP
jgi:hypothetical protein